MNKIQKFLETKKLLLITQRLGDPIFNGDLCRQTNSRKTNHTMHLLLLYIQLFYPANFCNTALNKFTPNPYTEKLVLRRNFTNGYKNLIFFIPYEIKQE